MTPVRERVASLGIVGRMMLIGLAVGGALLAAMPLAYWLQQWEGVAAALAGAAVVWLASVLALGIGELFRRPGDALTGLVLGMLLRMTLPLAACVAVLLNGGVMAASGFVYFVLVFYLVALPVETMLAVSGIKRPQRC